jgi:hypothetical protein
MNAKKFTVIGLMAIVVLFLYLGMNAYKIRVQTAQDVQVKTGQTRLVCMHSPVVDPQAAPVTIVDFFDPACETCCAFHPIVKDLMSLHPNPAQFRAGSTCCAGGRRSGEGEKMKPTSQAPAFQTI